MKVKKYIFTALFFIFTYVTTFSQIQLTLPTINGNPGTETIANVLVSDLTSYHTQGYQFKIIYNSAIVDLLNPGNTTGTISQPIYGENQGYLIVTAVSGTEYQGSGILFKIKIKFKQVGSTDIDLDPTYTNKFSGGAQFTLIKGRATVSTTNLPPVFDAVSPKTVNEGQELKFTINAVDPEGAPVTYSVVSKPEGSNFNATTKEFSWTPTYKQAGNYTATFSASDGNSSATLNVSITVVDVNTPPQINAIPDKTINEGEQLTFEVIATDNEGDALTYSASNTPAGSDFNPTTHIFSWKPTGKQAGDYTVTFSVSDGVFTSSINVKIKVLDVNVAPVIQPIADKTVNTGQTLTFEVIATDDDGDALTYGYIGSLPQGAIFDATTHKFNWKPTSTQAGDYEVTFFVYDGKLMATVTVKIKVIKVNSAPVFTKWLPDTTISVHNVQVLFKYQYQASDPDGDNVTFKLNSGPEGSTMTSSGLFQWIPKVTQAGQSFLVMVTISDGSLSETITSTLSTNPTIVGVEDNGSIPTKFNLHQNYPNPFNPTTAIKFEIPKESYVTLRVYNSIGKDVAELVNRELSAGQYQISFDAKDLPSGIYYYKLQAGEFTQTRKMLLVK